MGAESSIVLGAEATNFFFDGDLNPLDFYLWGRLKSLVYSAPADGWEILNVKLW
jgi:hypothetical protein